MHHQSGAKTVLMIIETSDRLVIATMMRIIPLSLPSLVAVVLIVNFYTSGANGDDLTCTSPCQHTDASGPAGIALPPCIISTTRSCQTDENVPVIEAPGGPLQVGIESSSYIGSDGKVYLDMAPHWQASPDRISLLTGYEVKVMCHSNICATQYFCVTMLFNRTLTVNDTNSNFSVSCQYGDFSQPSMDYVTIIRSLPNSDDNTNEGRFIAALPSCEQEQELSVCNIDSPEDWKPRFRPIMNPTDNGSVVVSFWPNDKYKIYVIILEEVINANNYYDRTVDTETDGPSVLFNNVEEGTYKAYVMIDECDDCSMFSSNNNFNVKAVPTRAPPTTPPAPPATSSVQSTLSSHRSTTSSSPTGSSLPLAAISGALGGILLVILIVIFVACTCKWSPSPPPFGKPSGEEVKIGEDATKSAMPQYNNSQYGDCDSLNGKSYMNQWPLMNGSTTYYSDSPSCRFTSPSMAAPILHNDNLINGRLLHESQFYADSMAYQQGDSVSKVAVDIHSSVDPVTFSKGVEPESPDSGLELIFSDDMTDDGRTLFSLALTTMGDEV